MKVQLEVESTKYPGSTILTIQLEGQKELVENLNTAIQSYFRETNKERSYPLELK